MTDEEGDKQQGNKAHPLHLSRPVVSCCSPSPRHSAFQPSALCALSPRFSLTAFLRSALLLHLPARPRGRTAQGGASRMSLARLFSHSGAPPDLHTQAKQAGRLGLARRKKKKRKDQQPAVADVGLPKAGRRANTLLEDRPKSVSGKAAPGQASPRPLSFFAFESKPTRAQSELQPCCSFQSCRPRAVVVVVTFLPGLSTIRMPTSNPTRRADKSF
ncbi:hypothetical protein ANO11243_062930 [Dothideomycetidae sp. 11243]|nr:hypothetical protein ANO11243_062930 [fungal sp. No.11243]